MSIPKNINVEHIILALGYIKKRGVPNGRLSTKYALVYNERNYPPKYTLSIANKFANGYELEPTEFSGGVEANGFLSRLGFIIIDELNQVIYTDIGDEAIQSFHKTVVAAYKTARTECGYNARAFIRMISERGAVNVAKDFLARDTATTGFDRLWRENRLDLTIEAHVLLPQFKVLFTVEERRAAFERLKKYGYVVQGILFDNNDNSKRRIIEKDIIADEIENELNKEGALKEYYGKRYERVALNREKAIQIHGINCIVCGFNFEKVYGDRGKDFIEVHHIKPLSSFGGVEVEINPETDLVPVCSNCHRMIHRRYDEVLTIEQLREIVKVSL